MLSGISLKTQELYAIVFLARYLDFFTDFISVYNTVMKLVFVGSSLAIVYCMRFHHVVRRSYDRELDTFRHYLLVVFCFLLALLVHENFTFQEVRYSPFRFKSWLFDFVWSKWHLLIVVFSTCFVNKCLAYLSLHLWELPNLMSSDPWFHTCPLLSLKLVANMSSSWPAVS